MSYIGYNQYIGEKIFSCLSPLNFLVYDYELEYKTYDYNLEDVTISIYDDLPNSIYLSYKPQIYNNNFLIIHYNRNCDPENGTKFNTYININGYCFPENSSIYISDLSIKIYRDNMYDFKTSLIHCNKNIFYYVDNDQVNFDLYSDQFGIVSVDPDGQSGNEIGYCKDCYLGGEPIIVNGKYYSVYYDGTNGYVSVYNIEGSDCTVPNMAFQNVYYDAD